MRNNGKTDWCVWKKKDWGKLTNWYGLTVKSLSLPLVQEGKGRK